MGTWQHQRGLTCVCGRSYKTERGNFTSPSSSGGRWVHISDIQLLPMVLLCHNRAASRIWSLDVRGILLGCGFALSKEIRERFFP